MASQQARQQALLAIEARRRAQALKLSAAAALALPEEEGLEDSDLEDFSSPENKPPASQGASGLSRLRRLDAGEKHAQHGSAQSSADPAGKPLEDVLSNLNSLSLNNQVQKPQQGGIRGATGSGAPRPASQPASKAGGATGQGQLSGSYRDKQEAISLSDSEEEEFDDEELSEEEEEEEAISDDEDDHAGLEGAQPHKPKAKQVPVRSSRAAGSEDDEDDDEEGEDDEPWIFKQQRQQQAGDASQKQQQGGAGSRGIFDSSKEDSKAEPLVLGDKGEYKLQGSLYSKLYPHQVGKGLWLHMQSLSAS